MLRPELRPGIGRPASTQDLGETRAGERPFPARIGDGRRGRSVLPQSEKKWSSDRELVEAILGGSREHFDLLYEAYFPRVYRFALKRLGDAGDAEDVAQEVFFTVFNSLHSYQGTAS